MEKAAIEEAVCEILVRDGPDGHCDGAAVLTAFIMALLAGAGEKWLGEYMAGKRS